MKERIFNMYAKAMKRKSTNIFCVPKVSDKDSTEALKAKLAVHISDSVVRYSADQLDAMCRNISDEIMNAKQ